MSGNPVFSILNFLLNKYISLIYFLKTYKKTKIILLIFLSHDFFN